MTSCMHERTWMVRVWFGGNNAGIAHVCTTCSSMRWDHDDEWFMADGPLLADRGWYSDGEEWPAADRMELLPPHPAVTEPPAALAAEVERLRSELALLRKAPGAALVAAYPHAFTIIVGEQWGRPQISVWKGDASWRYGNSAEGTIDEMLAKAEARAAEAEKERGDG